MATIVKEALVRVQPAVAWAAIRDFGNVHRLFPNMLIESTLEGQERVVSFRDGRSIRETLVTSDDAAMRLVYAIVNGNLRHYQASVHVAPAPQGSRVVWTVDLLPDDAAPMISRIMDAGIADLKAALEASASP